MQILGRSVLRQRESKGLTHSDSFGVQPGFSHGRSSTHPYLVGFCCPQETEDCYAKTIYCTDLICVVIKDPVYLTSKFRISYQIFEAECSPKGCCWRKVLGAGRLPWALGAGLALVAAKPWGRTRKGLLELLGCSVFFCCFVVLQDELGHGKALSAVVSLPLLLPLCHFTGDIALQNCQFGPSVTPTVIISLCVIED